MPSSPLAHISLLVHDLDQAVEDWTKILGVLDPDQLTQQMEPARTPSSGAAWPSAASTCTTSA